MTDDTTGLVWEVTPEIRWHARYGHLPQAPSVLQQLWVCYEMGYDKPMKEWRDVPTVG